jgi:hypothetical protein
VGVDDGQRCAPQGFGGVGVADPLVRQARLEPVVRAGADVAEFVEKLDRGQEVGQSLFGVAGGRVGVAQFAQGVALAFAVAAFA